MFLSALYTIFAVLLFLCHAGEEKCTLRLSDGLMHHHHLHDSTGGVEFVGTATNKTPLVSVVTTPGFAGTGMVGDHHHLHHHRTHSTGPSALGDGFITMDNSSQGTTE
jgi:hypothetical protein